MFAFKINFIPDNNPLGQQKKLSYLLTNNFNFYYKNFSYCYATGIVFIHLYELIFLYSDSYSFTATNLFFYKIYISFKISLNCTFHNFKLSHFQYWINKYISSWEIQIVARTKWKLIVCMFYNNIIQRNGFCRNPEFTKFQGFSMNSMFYDLKIFWIG